MGGGKLKSSEVSKYVREWVKDMKIRKKEKEEVYRVIMIGMEDLGVIDRGM